MELLLFVLGLVLLLLAGIGVPSPPRFSLGWFGLFFIFASQLVTRFPLR
jgi:hypothetical protein